MKPYFIKYLHVEGEINIGDYYKYNNSYPVKHLDKETVPKTKNYKKVEPFLCSRDIKEGDKFKTIYNLEVDLIASDVVMGSGTHNYPNEMLVWNKLEDNTKFWRLLKECFKIIGPISKDAVWVQEGFEYDADQISYPWTSSIDNYEKKSIKIKCPCCDTFK